MEAFEMDNVMKSRQCSFRPGFLKPLRMKLLLNQCDMSNRDFSIGVTNGCLIVSALSGIIEAFQAQSHMAQKMLKTMKTISEIVSMPWTPEIGDHIFTVIATVDGIYHEAGWFYATCSQCSKILDVVNDSFWCNICNGSSLYPMVRFRVHLRVQDDSGATIFTMYNQQTEQLIDTSANKPLNRLGIGSNGFPVEICSLSGRAFAFSIRMPDYFNPDYDFHHHRVVRLSEIDPTPPASSPATHPKKIKRKTSRAAVPVVNREEMHTSEAQPCGTEESTCAGVDVADTATPMKSN